jgi:hypothetical protein
MSSATHFEHILAQRSHGPLGRMTRRQRRDRTLQAPRAQALASRPGRGRQPRKLGWHSADQDQPLERFGDHPPFSSSSDREVRRRGSISPRVNGQLWSVAVSLGRGRGRINACHCRATTTRSLQVFDYNVNI